MLRSCAAVFVGFVVPKNHRIVRDTPIFLYLQACVQGLEKGRSGLTVEQEVTVMIAVREQLLAGGVALVDVQRPSCMHEGVVEPSLRLAVTSIHPVKDIEVFGVQLQVRPLRFT